VPPEVRQRLHNNRKKNKQFKLFCWFIWFKKKKNCKPHCLLIANCTATASVNWQPYLPYNSSTSAISHGVLDVAGCSPGYAYSSCTDVTVSSSQANSGASVTTPQWACEFLK
jgi:hypothetical protein